MARVAGRLNAALAEFCELLVEADRAQGWLADGAPNVVQWLTARFGIEAGFGRHLTRLSHRLDSLPELSKRFAAGELSLDAVELLAEVATPETELELIEDALGGDLAAIARSASRRKGLTAEESQMEREAEWFSTQWDLQHRKTRMAGELTGMDAQLVEDRLVEGAKKTPKNPETETCDDWNKRMADALVEVCATEGGNAPVPVLTVHARPRSVDRTRRRWGFRAGHGPSRRQRDGSNARLRRRRRNRTVTRPPRRRCRSEAEESAWLAMSTGRGT